MHTPAKVIFYKSKPVAQGKSQLRNRVRTRLGDMIAGYRDGIKITDFLVNEILLNVAHHAQSKFSRENTGILCLIFFQNIRLYRTPHGTYGIGFNFMVYLRRKHLIAGNAQQH
ncbi:hypothetical protein D9M68_573790 [compost metagenome]